MWPPLMRRLMMKKLFVFLTALLGVTSLSLTLNPDFDRVSADTKDGYVMCGEGTAKEDYFWKDLRAT